MFYFVTQSCICKFKWAFEHGLKSHFPSRMNQGKGRVYLHWIKIKGMVMEEHKLHFEDEFWCFLQDLFVIARKQKLQTIQMNDE